MEYFVHKDGQHLGPFSESRIRAGIESGEFATNDMGWREGLADWLPLSQIIPPSPPALRHPSPPAPTTSRRANKGSLSGLKLLGIIGVALLYPIVYLFGLFSGITRTMNAGGAITLEDDLATQTVIVAGPSVVVYIHSISDVDPERVAVDFKNKDSGKILSSEILQAERDNRGHPNFSFHLPGSANAVIHRL